MSNIHSQGQRVFVTGISGFIAYELAEELLRRGYKVAGLVRQSTRENDAIRKLRGRVTFYQGDLRDYWALKKCLDDYKPDYICHLGAITPVSYSFDHPHEVTEVNYMGVINLVEAAKQAVPTLKKLIFSGSMEEYGFQPEHFVIKDNKVGSDIEPFVEERELHPACPYAVAKVAAEKYLQYSHFAYGFPSITLRQTNCYGRKENDYFVVEAIITKMLKNPEEVSLGRSLPVRNFIHITDLINAWMTLIEMDNPELFGEAFNVGPENGLSIQELAKTIARKLDWNGKINWDTRELRPGEIFYLNSSNDKLTKMTGWVPILSLDEGLDRTIKYWRDRLSRLQWISPRNG